MTKIYSLDKLDPIAMEAVRGSTAQSGIYVTPMLIRRFKGDGNTTIIFKRLLYCSEQWGDEEGWFFQTAGTIEKVTGLGNRALQRSVGRLEKMGLLEKKLGGIPYKAYYRINLSVYLELIRSEANLATSDKAAEANLATSDKASPPPSDKASPPPSDEISLATRGKEVILSDLSSDTKSDTYISANADFFTSTEVDPDLPLPPTSSSSKGYYSPGPGKLVSCVDPVTDEEVGELPWRVPQGQIANQAFAATGRTRLRYGSKAEFNKMQRIVRAIDNGKLPRKFWDAQLACARNYRWPFKMLLKSTMNPDRLRGWEASKENVR